MARKVSFILCLHSHQPVGNFDYIFETVYGESYLPFIEEFERYPEFPVSLHFSGPLLEWLEENHPEYLEKIKTMVERKQIEIIGGAFYEPILSLINSKDRESQIHLMQNYIKKHFNYKAKGFWLAERVWEQGLVYDMANSGVEFTMVDHTHFLYAGFNKIPSGYYVAEDRGKFVYVFPLNEDLRYLIPFKPVDEVIEYLKTFLDREKDEAIVVYGDDGEKFGSWPGTHNLIYKDKWLSRFIERCMEEKWLEITTFEKVLENFAPQGLCYLPDASYREMMQWALYPDEQKQLEFLYNLHKSEPEYLKFIRGGSFRNFRKKYPESHVMYSRMIDFSNNVTGEDERNYLLRSQCNCAYWHGVFGGIYLPHLRNAVFENIIRGEEIIFKNAGVDYILEDRDINFDGEKEVILWNRYMKLIFEPHNGGRAISWDIVPVHTNIQSTFSRQKEYYHRYVLKGGKRQMLGVHDIPVLKEKGLEKYLVYDSYHRLSFVEHCLNTVPSAEDIEFLRFKTDEGFLKRKLDYRLCKKRCGVEFLNKGVPEKKINLDNSEILIELSPVNCSTDFFALEFNLFTLSAETPDKSFFIDGEFVGNAGVKYNGKGRVVEFEDRYRGFSLKFVSEGCYIKLAPIYTVNLSESGIERVFQNSTIFLIFETLKDKINLKIELKTH